MTTSNQRREQNAFSAPLKTRVEMPQDVFLQNNKYLLDEYRSAPRGGSCEGMDTRIWFSVSQNGHFTKAQIADRDKAVSICRTCPIRTECLMYSLEYEPYGIWGGFTEPQRTLLRLFWKITPKRPWITRSSIAKYRRVPDYITYPEDIDFIKKVAHDNNLAQPFANERPSVSSSSRRRIRPRVAH